MSVRAMAWVFHDCAVTTSTDRLVLLALADEADDDGLHAFPSVDLLAVKARVHRATALRAVARLEAGGELLVLRPSTRGRGKHNRYALCLGRDPLVLAAELGWPAPVLSDAVRQEWSHAATVPGGGIGSARSDHSGAVDNSGNGGAACDLSGSVNGPEWSQRGPEMVAPGATRPVYPIDTRGAQRRFGGRRRGLDPAAPTPMEQTAAAMRRLGEEHTRRLAAERDVPVADPAVAAETLAEARERLRKGAG